MLFWLSLTAFIVSLAGIIFIFARHYIDLLILNVETLGKSDIEIRKEQILEERIKRFWRDRFHELRRAVRLARNFLKPRILLVWTRLLEIQRQAEQSRSRFNQPKLAKQEKIKELVALGAEDAMAGNFTAAEGKFIDAIRLDPRAAPAYKSLAEVYIAKKSYKEAEETLEFLTKLTPADAAAYISLVKVTQEQGEHAKLLEYLAKLVELDSNNPKYLDLLVETSIMLGNKRLARQALERLRKVNPDNQKIPDFETRINALR